MKNKLIKYLLISFLITWVCWWGDALLVKLTSLNASDFIPMVLFTVGGFGPTIAACACLDGGFSWKKLAKLLSGYKKHSIWYMLAFSLAEITVFFLSSKGISFSFEGAPAFMIPIILLIVFLQAAVLYGGNEELGWRGILQSLLQKKMPYIPATLIVGAIWVSWHIPLWFIEGDSHQSMSFASFAILGIMLSFWLSAICNISGSIIFCMIIHGITNTLMGIFIPTSNIVYWIGLSILTVAAIVIGTAASKRQQKLPI
ncbi:MAG: CPBP family intramembrane metalloprotease [Clostridia bacterium]|nr:CPBP family intramembrane metalloprotease [Clostridia bacterium]MBR5947462.1 CPBP family intramembrane metalloprotease [Clostridia bacterium]